MPLSYMTFRQHNTGAWMVGQINVLMALNDIGPGDGELAPIFAAALWGISTAAVAQVPAASSLVDEERPLAPAEQHDSSEATGPALSPASNALLDDASPEVGIDLASFGTPGRIAEGCIRDSLATGETRERFGLERAQSEPRVRHPACK